MASGKKAPHSARNGSKRRPRKPPATATPLPIFQSSFLRNNAELPSQWRPKQAPTRRPKTFELAYAREWRNKIASNHYLNSKRGKRLGIPPGVDFAVIGRTEHRRVFA